MNFIPYTGVLFYARSAPWTKVIETVDKATFMPVLEKVTMEDNSYRDRIFRCVAADDSVILGNTVVGPKYSDGPTMFTLDGRYIFAPVGPEIIKYFKLEENSSNE